MKITPIKTRILHPPQDDLFVALEECDLRLSEKQVVVITSKIVAIHEGRCIPVGEVEKEELVRLEADLYIKESDSRWRITSIHNTFLSSAGIDESNADGHYILLPKNPHQSAEEIWIWITEKFNIDQIGMIVADSTSKPLRCGTVGVALGWYGFEPVTYFTGKPDLFGRPAQFTRINVADSLATAGVFSMGEMSEQTPVAIIEDIPHINFVERDTSDELTIPPREDIYWPLIKRFYE